jgi:hypothetical protein
MPISGAKGMDFLTQKVDPESCCDVHPLLKLRLLTVKYGQPLLI